jgi:DNA-binding MarR family transcriptional regulator
MPAKSKAQVEEPLIGALLRFSWEAVRRRVLDDLAAAGFGDIGQAHLAVLQYPAPRGVRVTDLAAGARMSRQAINYLIRELEQKGYLERRPDPSDGRSRLVHLTPRGEAATRSIRAAVRCIEREWEQQLGRRRFAELRSTLRALRQAPGLDDA